MVKMKTALTIAGSDPSGGAGIQADLTTFEALGVRALSAITALTAQNSTAVRSVRRIPASFLKAQIDALLEEFTIDAAKTGMIGSAANLRAIRTLMRTGRIKNLVVDTPLSSTGGHPLIDARGAKELSSLLPYAAVVTPNLAEAAALTGVRITGLSGMEKAARALFGMGAANVLVKGGHLDGAPTDLLYDGKNIFLFKGKRIKGPGKAFHGTGCMLSAALAGYLARGKSVKEAVGEAKRFLEKELERRVFRDGATRGPGRSGNSCSPR